MAASEAEQRVLNHRLWAVISDPRLNFSNIDWDIFFMNSELYRAMDALPRNQENETLAIVWTDFWKFDPTLCQIQGTELAIPPWPPGLRRVPVLESARAQFSPNANTPVAPTTSTPRTAQPNPAASNTASNTASKSQAPKAKSQPPTAQTNPPAQNPSPNPAPKTTAPNTQSQPSTTQPPTAADTNTVPKDAPSPLGANASEDTT